MILVANGDSHTYGEGLELGKSTFSKIVATHFNMPLINNATPGGSNDCIIRTSSKLLSKNTFVLIGWTSWEREEWLFNNEYYQINSTGIKPLPTELHNRFKDWVTDNTFKSMVLKSQSWHEKIWSYHKLLKSTGVKHLFFNAFTPFMALDTPNDLLPMNNKDWDMNYISPYDSNNTYLEFLISKGCTPNKHLHFTADGHQIWGEYLINYIEENNLI